MVTDIYFAIDELEPPEGIAGLSYFDSNSIVRPFFQQLKKININAYGIFSNINGGRITFDAEPKIPQHVSNKPQLTASVIKEMPGSCIIALDLISLHVNRQTIDLVTNALVLLDSGDTTIRKYQ